MRKDIGDVVFSTWRKSADVAFGTACLLLSALAAAGTAEARSVPALIPKPVSVQFREGSFAVAAGEFSRDVVTVWRQDGGIRPEGYRLEVASNGITVVSSDDAGAFYAVQTLRQLASKAVCGIEFPLCTIDDYPRFAWRGVHWDDSRHFFGKAAVKRNLDRMAERKFNVLHWHLTDNEGWRFPVAKYPRLATVGASRQLSVNHRNLADKFEDGEYGPFSYSRKDIEEIVAYAAARHIRIVPEVDVPGHCEALVRAYPERGCFADDSSRVPTNAVGNVICIGDDASLEMVNDIFDEVASLFPGEVVHIGGDEVDMVNYRACSKCQARMTALGLKSEGDLQAWFMQRVAEHLKGLGRRVIGWDALFLEGRAPDNAMMMGWKRDAKDGIAAVRAGLETVMCPHNLCYLDYSQGLVHDPEPYPWFDRPLPIRMVYGFDPLSGVPKGLERFVVGGQCCNWTEYTCNETELQWKMWPRACAMSEVLWSPAGSRDFGDFAKRAKVDRHRLVEDGVNCAPLADDVGASDGKVTMVAPVRPSIPKTAFTIATFNVRCPCDKGERAWYRRMPHCAEIVRTRGFDVFGVQEATIEEQLILKEELPEFAFVGCGRDKDRRGEGMFILYRKERFECLKSGTFWLSETPDEPGSKATGAACPRTCTWAHLRDRITGRRFRYFNTHLDHISAMARLTGVRVILDRGLKAALDEGETVFLTGDLNDELAKIDTPEAVAKLTGARLDELAKTNPIALLSTVLSDTIARSETGHCGSFSTFHGFTGVAVGRIDYVFSTPDVRVIAHETIEDRPDGEFASDHYPVAVAVELP